MTDPLNLDKIQALADAATPGPWGWEKAGFGDMILLSGADGVLFSYPVYDGPIADAHIESADLHVEPADAEFIAAARTLIPALVAQVRELQAENTRIQALREPPSTLDARNDIAELISMQLDLPLDITADAADVILDDGYRKPHTITTIEELEALPDYAVICYHDQSDGAAYPITARDARLGWDTWLPATVLFTPEVKA